MAVEGAEFYFNLNPEPDHLGAPPPADSVLREDEKLMLAEYVLNRPKTWYIHNSQFDLGVLAAEGMTLKGEIHDTQSGARVIRNDYFQYDLAACASREGWEKSDAVENYIRDHGLSESVEIPGKQTRDRLKFFHLVPLSVLVPYACQDARVTFDLGRRQREKLDAMNCAAGDLPAIGRVWENERRLSRTVFTVVRNGIPIDRKYCLDAIEREEARKIDAAARFEAGVGFPFKNGFSCLHRAFCGQVHKLAEKAKFQDGTPKPSYDSEALETLAEKNPAARAVLDWRDAKSRLDFFHGFLFHADPTDRVHPSLKPDGTKNGRFSSAEPNAQNLTKPNEDEPESDPFPVRRAVVPRPGFFLAMFDYDQQEYRMMLDYAGARGLIDKVLAGLDVHQATADLSGLKRSEAKNANFAIIYGAGIAKQAAMMKIDEMRARQIRAQIFAAAPEIEVFIKRAMRVAENRGFVVNWLGRRCHFDDPRFAYRAPNAIIQGGAADVVKVAMNRVDDRLRGMKTKLIMNVHDELDLEVHESEASVLPEIKQIMESVYPHRFLPLTVSPSHSFKSLADKVKGFPT